MSDPELFGPIPPSESRKPQPEMAAPEGRPRLLRPDRCQMRFLPTDRNSLLDDDHPARAIWAVVETRDLSKFEAPIAARGETAGRPAIDPRILLTLWLYATSEGMGSARELERLCERHHAYQWICGGVHINHHTLSDFRVNHQEALDELMTQIPGVLEHQGLVDLKRVAQDGMRVRASAGAASFRREKSLRKCLDEAREQVRETAREMQAGPEASLRREAARQRAARERAERALSELPKVREAKKSPEDKTEARVSTTDPEARVMKMGDGGFRPAYNVQLATDTQTRVIVGVDVTNSGSDLGQMPPRKEGIDPHQPKAGDSPPVAEWRQRMGTPEAKKIYKQRAATAETVNADLRCYRGLGSFGVRTLPKVRCLVLWAALTYNLQRMFAATAREAEGTGRLGCPGSSSKEVQDRRRVVRKGRRTGVPIRGI
jgi:transposase